MNKIFIYLLFFLVINFPGFAQDQENTQGRTQKTYSAKPAVRINSRFCKLIIKESAKNEISISSHYSNNLYGNSNQSILKRLFDVTGIEVNELHNRLDIYINPALKNNGTTDKDTKNIILKELIITVPPDTDLDISSDYGNVIIHQRIKKASIKINNATLDMSDVNELKLNGVYCNAHAGNIKNAIIQFDKSSLNAMEIEDLDLDSKNSTIDYNNGKRIYMLSFVDEINIQSIGEADGRTTWGTINITELKQSLSLQSKNTNLKLRQVDPATEYIKINNSNSEMRISLRNIKNYSVDFSGKMSRSVTPFEKIYVTEAGKTENAKYEHFKGSGGNVQEAHTRIEVTCDACIVDFK